VTESLPTSVKVSVPNNDSRKASCSVDTPRGNASPRYAYVSEPDELCNAT